jgi:ankyrin repeat protein
MSSFLNVPAIETTEHIGRNHMEMCRFASLDDMEYKKVAAALGRMTTTISRKSRVGSVPLSNEQRQVLLKSLSFSQIDARQMTIKNAHAKTCKWLLHKREYLDWLDPSKFEEHHGLLWIKGKPGTGKSTLMKFALAHARKKLKEKTVISFFFNARGDDLEKSTIGMYRSLLLQLIERFPAFQAIHDSLGLSMRNNAYPEWSIEALKSLFGQVIQSLGEASVLCLIDALDECEEHQIRDMISFFEHVGDLAVSSGLQLHVCFSSRHYPHITIRRGVTLVLEGQEGHTQDILNYINSELKIGHSKLAETIRAEIQEKAAGVFIWVALVVEMLNKEHDGGRIHALRRRIRDIPADLHELFHDILTRDDQDKNELVLCIQWILFARQPLTPEQLYFAILAGVQPEALGAWDSDEITAATIERFILQSSKGLAEVTKSNSRTVQFIHESVVDFLAKENGLRKIWPDIAWDKGQNHEDLKRCCIQYMGIDLSSHVDLSEPLPKASSPEAAALRQSVSTAFPLLEYAVRNVLYHANISEGLGVAQKDFLSRFLVAEWVQLDNLFEKRDIRRHTPKVSLLYMLAEANLANLIEVHPSIMSGLEVEEERYGPPLFAAFATGSDQAVETLLKAQKPTVSPTRAPKEHDHTSEEPGAKVNFGREFKFSSTRTVLSYIAQHGNERVLADLLTTGKFMHDSQDKDGQTPLLRAVESGNEATLRLLLENGADIEAKGADEESLLFQAVKAEKEAVTRLLIDKGADIETKDKGGETPLSWAARHEKETMVHILAERGADMEAIMKGGWTPLCWAVRFERESMIRLLVAKGADIESSARNSITPLLWAINNGTEAMIRLLVEMGADIEAHNNDDGRTALSLAVGYGNEVIAQLLIEKGATIEARDKDGQTPLSWAAGRGKTAMLRLLLANGADIETRDNDGQTPLLRAARDGKEAMIRVLLANGADIEAKGEDCLTPLLWATKYEKRPIIRLLLSKGADIEARGEGGLTPLLSAVWCGEKALIELLLEKGADIEARDRFGLTPLSRAVRYGNEAIVELLLEKGANIEAEDKYGCTPLMWADQRQRRGGRIPYLLYKKGANLQAKDKYGWRP